MGRKTRMPRLPPILGKGAAHKDRRREAQDNWLQEARDDAQDVLISPTVDNPNEQEDNDA